MRYKHGSFFNQLMDSSKQPVPQVGDGATLIHWSDREAGTIVKVLSPKRLVWQRDKAIRTDGNKMSDAQSYRYEQDPTAPEVIFTLRSNGRWVQVGDTQNGSSLGIGYRREYHDYGF